MISGNVITGITNKKIEGTLVAHLKKSGYQVISFDEGNSLIRAARSRNVDLLIIDEEMKGLRTIDIVNVFQNEKISPVILVTAQPRTDYISWIQKGWIFNYIHQNIEIMEFGKAVSAAMVFGKKLLDLENEVLKLKKTLADRKTIEKAKGIIMEMKSCSEEDAYGYLRKTSMEKKVSIEILAQAIINKYK
ncbi:ANTAR domain-containing response regulator [Alkalibacter mobilis]|uniref:ANTAR domain-containing response regulator n=1 Tax=Alkalibacter mobilis TaxID=2787712 RepID=UPI00189DA169|nr:ANTAR domain-containing protein [Alkalibacter mobilis]MBF7096615.1 ANTAR domain-containing protein [Alkalibacter mobilis]